MKTKVAALLLLLASSWAAQAGPHFAVSVGSGCGYAPAAFCRPAYPAFYSCAVPYYGYGYGWGGGPIIVSTGFSNVSPLVAYGDTPVYQVPAPVLPATPIAVYPASTFGWRH